MLVGHGSSRVLLSQHFAPNTRLKPALRSVSHWALNLSAPVQSYISTSHDPYINLAFEHYLLKHTSPESAVLFLYRNRPCVVIGRNQNPWLELNLKECLRLQKDGSLDIVRRRSGGGTVYHDLGNTNWTIISPPKHFTRDKHVEMVVRALRSPACGVKRARVNERHDIVLDQGDRQVRDFDACGTHLTPWTDTEGPAALKCSGSAFKLTRNRALHHGTCLLNTTSLESIGRLLSSPARPYIRAKGVESVPSPVGNTGLEHTGFVRAVQDTFSELYSRNDIQASLETVEVTDFLKLSSEEDLRSGHDELKSPAWTYGQTPSFTFSVNSKGQVEKASDAPNDDQYLELEIRQGRITSVEGAATHAALTESSSGETLSERSLLDAVGWKYLLNRRGEGDRSHEKISLVQFMDDVLPIVGSGKSPS